MTRVLISVASRHGSTKEIGNAIAAHLNEAGLQATVTRPEDVADIGAFDAVIIGSGVYAGHWLKPARQLVEDHAPALRHRPTWLFSVGPLGDPPTRIEEPADVEALVAAIHPRQHRMFSGVLERGSLGLMERAVVGVVKAPFGDFRNWSEIADWARSIADELRAVPVG